MATITWLDKIDGLDLNDPQKNVNAADMNMIKTVVNANASLTTTAQSEIDTHEALTNNPHSVTKTQVGLGLADNTSDANKPVSTAQATAIGVVQSDVDTHEALTNNPHSVTKAQVGLSLVDNTSDATKLAAALAAALASFVWGEVPSGTLNGVNQVFTIANSATKLAVYKNGIRQTPTASYTFTPSTNTFTFVAAPESDDVLLTDSIKS